MVFSHSVNVETSCRERWLPLAAQWIPSLWTLDALALYLVLYCSLVFACLFDVFEIVEIRTAFYACQPGFRRNMEVRVSRPGPDPCYCVYGGSAAGQIK